MNGSGRGCEFYADALVERALGGLDAERARRLDTHLAECPDCVDSLRVVTTLRAAPIDAPAGLEARIQAAVREAIHPAGEPATAGAVSPRPTLRRTRWRPWALPLAAAAAAAGLWFGVGLPGTDRDLAPETALAAAGELDPYGAWPAGGVIVAGDPLLSELSVEELERLLEEGW